MAKKSKTDDPAMAKVRELWAKQSAAGVTMQQLGERMGYPAESARKSVSQFLQSHDPQVSTLRRFASATGLRLSTLLRER